MIEQAMEELNKKRLLKGLKSCFLKFCKHCTLEKQHKVSFNLIRKENQKREVLYYFHSNVWILTPTRSHGSACYFVAFLDDYSRKIGVYIMREKFEIFQKFKKRNVKVDNQTNTRSSTYRAITKVNIMTKDSSIFASKKALLDILP